MSEQNRTILKSYFETNAIPTSVQFANFIDSVLNKREDEITVSSGNIGFGNQNPLTNVAVQSKIFQLSGTVSADKNSNSFTGINTVFGSQLIAGDTIQIKGQVYTVTLITSNTAFTTKQNTNSIVTNATVQKTADIFSVQDTNGNEIIYVTKDGKVGFSKTNPSELVDIAGNLKAEGLIGNGSGITRIQANQLEGIIPENNLPNIHISSIEGLLTITEMYDQPLTGTVSGTKDSKVLRGNSTKFLTELVLNQKILVAGVMLQVNGIRSDTVLTLKNALVETIPDVQAFAKGNFLELIDVDGTQVASIDGLGNISANEFIGNGSKLTNIQADELDGIISENNLPEPKVSSIDGLLTITEAYDTQISGMISGTLDAKILNGTATKFQTELVVDQKIMVGKTVFEVETITSDISLTVKNALAETITDENIFIAGNFLELIDIDGTQVASIDGLGNISANEFIGNGSKLTNIQANELDGIISENNLPEPKISSIDGLLTITEAYDTQISGTISGTLDTKTLNGTATKFQTELVVDQKIMVGKTVFEVETITSDISLTVKNALAETITDENIFIAGNFLKLIDVDGTQVASIDGLGNISANEFIGNGSKLTNIQADQLEGIISENNLPEPKISSIDGLLTITEAYDTQISGTISGTLDTKILNGTATKFQTELVVDQKIMVGKTVFEVETITSDISLTVKNALAETITDENIFIAGNFLKLIDIDGTQVASIDGLGNILANEFIGNGSKLTNIQANELEGIISENNLPEPKVSSIDGLLTITEAYDAQISGTISGTLDTKILNGTATKFQTELVVDQKIMVGKTVFEVETITSDISLTVKNALVKTITDENIFIAGNFLKLINVDGTQVASIDGLGNISATSFSGNASGLTNIPADKITGDLNLTGNITATSFSGNASGLTNIPADKITGDLNLTGNITATSFSGNASGLTNIPADKITGNLNLTGDITATSFSGSASGLTNIPADKITGDLNLTGNITATSFSGDASGLTNIPADKITGDLNLTGNITATRFSGDASGLTNIPADKITGDLNLTGNISATSFSGNASGLTNLNATQLTGLLPEASIPQIDATKISGTIAIASIPTIPSSKVLGKLTIDQIPTLIPEKVENYISVIADETILLNEATLSLSWKTNSVSILEIQYLHNNSIVKLSSSKNDIALTASNFLIKQLYQNTVFTFISTDISGTIVDKHQLYVTVVPTANQYTQQLKWEGFHITYTLPHVASRFALSELTKDSLTTLGTAIFKAGYTATDAFKFIPQYYRNQGETWDPAIDGQILTAIYSGGKPSQDIINQYAQYLVTAGDSPKTVVSSVVIKFKLETSSSANVTALGTAIKLAGVSAGDAFRYVASYYRYIGQPWNPGDQGVALTRVYTN